MHDIQLFSTRFLRLPTQNPQGDFYAIILAFIKKASCIFFNYLAARGLDFFLLVLYTDTMMIY
jgi:hypothetical protein